MTVEAQAGPDKTPPQENRTSQELLSRENIEAYMEGCEDLALRLNSTISKVIETGKRPIILIPSRGAVPIFLQARRILNDLDQTGSYLLDQNANYYPNGVFEYLEGDDPREFNPDAKVDIVLFPFTADVSIEESGKKANHKNGDDTEWLAKRLRESCARSVLALQEGDSGSKDLQWYEFIMSKLADNPDETTALRPKQILDSLRQLPEYDDAQIILIDTVISGRAAHDITTAFQSNGHPVVPILAVDSTKGGKFQPRRKAEIESTVAWDLIDEQGPFIYFPLITEDKGAALLGLSAINFANFNERGAFSRISGKFPEAFLPQSCVWTLPPLFMREQYVQTFRNFLEIAWRIHHEKGVTEEELSALQAKVKGFISTHSNPSKRELGALVAKGAELTEEAKETNSHIISVKLTLPATEDWIKEFAGK